jgi:hypothetical protein
MVTLGMFSLAMVALVVLACFTLRVQYRIERSTHHGLQRTVETGTAWLNPFNQFDAPFLAVVSVDSHCAHPTRIEQDYPDVFRVNLETDISSLETDCWLGYGMTTSGCGNVIIRVYEESEVFRQAIRRAVDDGRLDPFDLLPLTNYCSGPPPDSDGIRSPPGKALVTSLLYESLPRPALPAAVELRP